MGMKLERLPRARPEEPELHAVGSGDPWKVLTREVT